MRLVLGVSAVTICSPNVHLRSSLLRRLEQARPRRFQLVVRVAWPLYALLCTPHFARRHCSISLCCNEIYKNINSGELFDDDVVTVVTIGRRLPRTSGAAQ